MRIISEKVKGIIPEEFKNNFGDSQEEIIDYIFDNFNIEIRPRPYKGDFGKFLWCCEVHDWNNLREYPKIFASCETKEEAINNAIYYVFDELC